MELVKEKKHKEFKNTVLGKIPKDWRCVSFQDVLQGFTSGATPYRGIPEYYTGDVKWITSSELNYDIIYDTKEKITEEAVRKTNLRIHPPGTFLMAITGLEAEGTRGRCGIVGSEATTNQSCMALYPIESEMLAEYLFYFYQNYGDELAFKFCQGTKQQSYTASVVKILPITLPPTLEEQQAIAEALSDVDALIAELDALIEKKQQVKKGAMQQLLTSKKRLPGFNGEWEEKKLGDLGNINTGGTPSTKNESFWNGDYPWVTPTDIDQNKNIFNTEREITTQGLSRLSKLPADTLLVTCIASIGKNAVLRKEGSCNQQINALTPNEENDVDFLYYLIELRKNDLLDKAGITATLIISKKNFTQLVFEVPTLEEQKAIAQILSDMDREIQTLQSKRSKYEQIKQGMMQELLTGKTRLV